MNSVRQEIRLLEGEISSLDTRLKTFSYPPNLGGGIAILCYLAAVGIIFPIVLIRSEFYHDTLKSITIALFSVGIIVIFAYLISLIKRLRSKNAQSKS